MDKYSIMMILSSAFLFALYGIALWQEHRRKKKRNRRNDNDIDWRKVSLVVSKRPQAAFRLACVEGQVLA